jgi:hypothetical protein
MHISNQSIMKYMGNSQLTNDTMLGTKYMKYRKYFEHNQTNYDIKTYQYLNMTKLVDTCHPIKQYLDRLFT